MMTATMVLGLISLLMLFLLGAAPDGRRQA
jgi:hypothetical protein